MSHVIDPMNDVMDLDATAQAELVRTGRISARELVEASLARIDALNPELNAVVGLDAERALAQARSPGTGPFAGVPFLTKDLLAQPGLRAAMGCRLFAGHVPTQDLPYTQAIDAAGLITLGKTTSSELGLLGSTETFLDGITHNPWGPTLSAGGSSGGAAAAVAAGLVPFAHASDGGGSIRLPAALAGLFGFKPSAGATLPSAPPSPMNALVSDHCVSRSVRDSIAFLQATSVPGQTLDLDAPLGALTVGVYTHTAFGLPATSEGLAAVEHAARLCEDLGHRVQTVEGPDVDGRAISDGFFALAGGAVGFLDAMLQPLLGRGLAATDVEPFTWVIYQWALSLGPDGQEQAWRDLQEQAGIMRRFLATCDVMLCPTVGGDRPQLGHLAPTLPMSTLMARTERLAGYTAVHNPAGAPAMSMPLHWTDDGLPVGVMFAASPGQDSRLLRLALQLERAAPWADPKGVRALEITFLSPS